jgi:ribulose-5-phosphate 4-epimerase/fuculose-1-phosphate aldolase
MNVLQTQTERQGRSSDCTDEEWKARADLAAAFRLASHFGWNDGLGNHISCRIPNQEDCFLINSRSYGWHEITAGNLVKLRLREKSDSKAEASVGPAGLNFHRAILRARTDMACVLHTHAMSGVMVSVLEDGLEILDQTGCMIFGEVASHAFEGYASESAEAERIVKDLGDKRVMLMWNHGLLSVGQTVGEAFLFMKRLIWACELQRSVAATERPIRKIPLNALEHIRRQIQEKRGGAPYGDLEWAMLRRLADKLDPAYAS